MLKDLFQRLTSKKKAMTFIGAAVLILLVVAVVVGVLNALIADGTWSIGWSSYRYDETDYEIGSGTIPSKTITSLEIDWLDGEVKLVLCDDAFISITEAYTGEIAESARLRHKVTQGGTLLSVKYRSSAAFLGCGGTGENKSLTVRIPKSMANLSSIQINAESANVSMEGISANAMTLSSTTGSITLSSGNVQALTVTTQSGNIDTSLAVSKQATLTSRRGNLIARTASEPEQLTLETEKGSVTLGLPAECGFTLQAEVDINRFACDRSLIGENGSYSYGDHATSIKLSAPKGSVSIETVAK